MSLIENDAEASTSQINTEQKSPRNNETPSPMAATYTRAPTAGTSTNPTAVPTTPTLHGFRCTLGASRYIECIAPNQKGNFIISICIDELNGWLLAGQCSGTLNAWKIPQNPNQKDASNKKNKVFECRNLLPCEEDGIRHIYCFDNNIICMVGYRRICSFINYDQSTEMKKKLGINDVFTYSPFTSPHMFYSTQHESVVHIFCRSFSCVLKIDLKTRRKEVLRLREANKISLKTNVLTVNKNFVIWQTLKTKYNFYVKRENLDRNKKKKQSQNRNAPNETNNRFMKWFNQWQYSNQSHRKYDQPTLKKIQIRSLQNFNLIHEEDYFEAVPFNAWGFQLDNVSMNMAFVVGLNVIQVVQITPDLNIMQYGLDYDKKQQPPQAKKATANDANNKTNTKRNDKSTHKNEIFVEALTLQAGLSASYDASMDTQSNNDNHMIDVLQNDDGNLTPVHPLEQVVVEPKQMENQKAKQLYTFRRHNGHILAIQYADGVLLSIATDRKLCVWNGRNGKHIATISNIPGTFTPGYPYIIKKSHSSPNQVFYTADDGIFMAVF